MLLTESEIIDGSLFVLTTPMVCDGVAAVTVEVAGITGSGVFDAGEVALVVCGEFADA